MVEKFEQMLVSLRMEQKQAEARYWELQGAINATIHWQKEWTEQLPSDPAPAPPVEEESK